MQGWARLDAAQRQRFFKAFVKAALRLDRLEFRAWLLRRLKNPPLAAPIDPARFAISDAGIAPLMRAARAKLPPGWTGTRRMAARARRPPAFAAWLAIGSRGPVCERWLEGAKSYRNTQGNNQSGKSKSRAHYAVPRSGRVFRFRTTCETVQPPCCEPRQTNAKAQRTKARSAVWA